MKAIAELMVDIEELINIQTDASQKISDALQPLNMEVAPFYIQLLRGYADVIEKQYPGASKVADVLDKCLERSVHIIDLDEEE